MPCSPRSRQPNRSLVVSKPFHPDGSLDRIICQSAVVVWSRGGELLFPCRDRTPGCRCGGRAFFRGVQRLRIRATTTHSGFLFNTERVVLSILDEHALEEVARLRHSHHYAKHFALYGEHPRLHGREFDPVVRRNSPEPPSVRWNQVHDPVVRLFRHDPAVNLGDEVVQSRIRGVEAVTNKQGDCAPRHREGNTKKIPRSNARG